jgi:hypothetical protein
MIPKDIKFFACLVLVFMLIVLASSMDYNDEITERGDYCDMIKNGDYPGSEATYSAYCSNTWKI